MQHPFGVLFDMDGVIVHSNPAHKKAIQEFCHKHGQDLSQEFLENRLYGRTNAEWIPELFGSISDERLNQLADEKEQMFRDMFTPEEHIVHGVIPFIKELKKQQVKIAVATSAPAENADYILNRLSIYSYFDAVLDSSHVSKGKPHPEPYLNAARAIGFDASSCIVIEDSVSGVKSGLNAGAKVVGITTTHTRKELGSCHLVIDDFEDLTLEDLSTLIQEKANSEV